MNIDIEQAIENLRRNATRYAKSERYYAGEHQLAFASEKFQNTFGNLFREFAMNLCPAICDAVRDKLVIAQFGIADRGLPIAKPQRRGDAEKIHKEIDDIWERNRMAIRSGEVHKEALKNGDAYAIVWPNAAGEPVIYPNRAGSCTVVFDEETPGRILWAAKYWRTADKRTRLNLFYPDRIEKYISARESEITLPDASDFVAVPSSKSQVPGQKMSRPQLGTPELGLGTIVNPYGVVPVFHFANNADIGTLGQSELEQAIPIQDGLNKSVLDMLVAMEFSAYRQRWAAGIEIEYDNDGKPIAPFTAGVDHLWISQDPNARFGDFAGSDLEHFLKVKDSFRIDIASVTGTPLHYLMPLADNFPSGESLRKAETRFISKVRSRQQAFGQVWADLMSFALRIAGHGRGIRLLTNWEDASPLSDREMLENILLKKQIGVPTEQALIEAGYGKEDIERMVRVEHAG